MATCALVGASDFNDACFRAEFAAGKFDAVFAVDGGFAALARTGVTPDVAIGDFDSLGFVPEAPEVLEYPVHKDESDMELALMLACERGFAEAQVYGALGGRLDHTLANLALFAAFSEKGLRVTAVDVPEKESAEGVLGTALTFLTGPAKLELQPAPGGKVSVFSMSDACEDVTELGLAYPLDHVTLTNRTSWGLSNEFTESPATVSLAHGTLVVFHPICACNIT